MANEGTDQILPIRRRRAHRRGIPWLALLITPIAFVLGAFFNPLASLAVDRWGPQILQGVDTTLGRSPLYIKETSWPFGLCGQTVVGIMGDGPPPGQFLSSSQGLNPSVLEASGIAIPWNNASLIVLLSTRQVQDTVLIESITPKIFKFKPENAKWTAGGPSACGGLDARYFDLQLKSGKGTLSDKGVERGPGGGPGQRPLPAEIPTEPLGDSFMVAANDAAKITFLIHPQDGYYEFGLEIAYSLNGEELTENIGTAENPYRVGGGTTLQSFEVDQQGKPVSVK